MTVRKHEQPNGPVVTPGHRCISQVRARFWALVSVLDASGNRVVTACTGWTSPKTSSRKTPCLC